MIVTCLPSPRLSFIHFQTDHQKLHKELCLDSDKNSDVDPAVLGQINTLLQKYPDAFLHQMYHLGASMELACVAGVRRGRDKGSSSAKRDRGGGWLKGGGRVPPPNPTIAIALRALCRASRSNSPSPFPFPLPIPRS